MATQEDSLDLDSMRHHALSLPTEPSQPLQHASTSSAFDHPSLNRAHALGQGRFNVHHGSAPKRESVSYSAQTTRYPNALKSDSPSSSAQDSPSTVGSGDTIPISQTEIQNFLNQSRALYQPYGEPAVIRLTGADPISQYSGQSSDSSEESQRLHLFSTLRDSTQPRGRRRRSSMRTIMNDFTEDRIRLIDDETADDPVTSRKSPGAYESAMTSRHPIHRHDSAGQPGSAQSLQTPNMTAASDNPFAGKLAPVLPLSQVFNGSSPGSGLLRSEISELPSPNIPISLNPTLNSDGSSPAARQSPSTRSFPIARQGHSRRRPSKLSRDICGAYGYERHQGIANRRTEERDDDQMSQDHGPRGPMLQQGSASEIQKRLPASLRPDVRPIRGDIFPSATFPAPTKGVGEQRDIRQRRQLAQWADESEEETEPDETASQRRSLTQTGIRSSSGNEDKENIRDGLIPVTGSTVRARNVFSQPLEVNGSPSFRARSCAQFTDSCGVSQSQPIFRSLGSQDNDYVFHGQHHISSGPNDHRAQLSCSQSEDETEQEDEPKGSLKATSRRASRTLRSRHLSLVENTTSDVKEDRYYNDMPVSQSQATVRAHEALSQILHTGSGGEDNGRDDDDDDDDDGERGHEDYVLKIHEDEEEKNMNRQSHDGNIPALRSDMESGKGLNDQDEQSGSQSSRKPLSQIGGSVEGNYAQSMVVPLSDTEDDSGFDGGAEIRRASPRLRRARISSMDGVYNVPNDEQAYDDNAPPPTRAYQTPAARVAPNDKCPSTIPETNPARLRAFLAESREDTPLTRPKDGETRRAQGSMDASSKPQGEADARSHLPAAHRKSRPKPRSSDPPSSPSGRRRRRLTEIAADGSQSQGQPLPDLSGLDVFTADDLEFQSLVGRHIPKMSNPASRRTSRTELEKSATFAGIPASHKGYLGTYGDENVTSENRVRSMPGLQNTPTPPESPPNESPVQLRIHKRGRDEDIEPALEYQGHLREPPRKRQRPVSAPQPMSEVSASSPLLPKRTPAIPVPNDKMEGYIPATPRHSSSQTRHRISSSESPDPLAAEDTIATPTLSKPNGSTTNQFTHPHQVFAFFNGRPQGFYPATCVGLTQKYGRRRYLVKFEGSMKADEVGEDGIKRLELRPGDHIKLDLLDMPKGGWTILGYSRKLGEKDQNRTSEEVPGGMMTDVFGHETVLVEHKTSTTTQKSAVSINHIWFDRQLWSRIEDRKYIHTEPPSASSMRFQTPVETASTPTFPASRASRGSRAPPTATRGIFTNMAFAVSIKDGGTNRVQIEKMIRTNGGRILQEGFDELFHVSRSGDTEEDSCLRLLPDFEHLGFISLITDEHSRRVKYMQALALNIPCLAFRWVKDCIDKDCLLDWDCYLLPAGESKFLDGAVKSRTLMPYPASTARLSQIVNQGHKLLAGQSVIFLAAKGKAAEARRAYAFLIYAMGAKTVSQVQDISAAIRLLKQRGEESTWDWIYVGDENSAPAACNALINEFAAQDRPSSRGGGNRSNAQKQQPKKRGRKSGAGVAISPNQMPDEPILINGKTLRILVNDFICQSLILGKLYADHN